MPKLDPQTLLTIGSFRDHPAYPPIHVGGLLQLSCQSRPLLPVRASGDVAFMPWGTACSDSGQLDCQGVLASIQQSLPPFNLGFLSVLTPSLEPQNKYPSVKRVREC